MENVYVTQAVQTATGSVTLVENRDALLRAFVTSDTAGVTSPILRAEVYNGETLLNTVDITSASATVPSTVNEASLTTSYNAVIPANQVTSNLRIKVIADPTNAIAVSDRSTCVFPRDGSSQQVLVGSVPSLSVTLVPTIVQGRTPDINSNNVEQYMAMTRQALPLQTVNVALRSAFTSSAQALQSNDANNAWGIVLAEMAVLRVNDGVASNMHYSAIVNPSYGSGFAGVATVPGRTSVCWDKVGTRSRILAHELGHNFALSHTAGCLSDGMPSYPYPNGDIGHYGWNAATNTIILPTAKDVMGYCDNQWISDFTWNLMRQGRAFFGSIVPAQAEESLILWGNVHGDKYSMEPSLSTITFPEHIDDEFATHEVVVYAENGDVLTSFKFMTEHVGCGHTHYDQFAFALPLTQSQQDTVGKVEIHRLADRSLVYTREGRKDRRGLHRRNIPYAGAEVQRKKKHRCAFAWRDSRVQFGMIRDCQTREVLGFVRNSGDEIYTGDREVELVVSTGLHTEKVIG